MPEAREPKLTMTVEEAAETLGVSRWLAYEMAKTGELPTLHCGRRLLVPVRRLLVQAAKRQSPRASEQLDRALRRAFWQHSRPIHLHHEILDIAASTDSVDIDQLDHHLRTGTARADVFSDLELAASPAIAMSPHVFLPNGTDQPNPGITVHWHGNWAQGFPVIDHDDPTIADTLLKQTTLLRR